MILRPLLITLHKHRVLSLILAGLLVGCLLVPSSTYANLLLGLVHRSIKSSDIYLATEGASLYPVGLSIKEMVIRPKRSLFGMTFSNVRFSPLFRDLLRGKLTLSVTGETLTGKFLIHYGPLRGKVSVKGVKLDLTKFPPVIALGLERALFNVELVDVAVENQGQLPEIFAFALSVDEVKKSQTSVISQKITRLPFDIQLPAIQAGSLVLAGKSSPKRLELDEMRFLSNLGRLWGKGHFDLSPEPTGELSVDGTLTKEGFTHFGTPLKLFSQGKVSNPNQPFQIKVSGPLSGTPNQPLPSISVTPMALAENAKEAN